MGTILQKTFGGLSREYYFRQLIFGAVLASLMIAININGGLTLINGGLTLPVTFIAILIVNALLYPYSRFVYESIMAFIMGDNVFFLNGIIMLFLKLMTMVLCFSFAIFIAPIGLIYLYFYHSR
jgi:hypothetical protein